MSAPRLASPIIFDHVWKRYRIGSQHDSLRDAIPALLKRWTHHNGHGLQDGEFWALQDVSFEVKAGETLGIVGPNGAGKSTVLKLLSNITAQTQGTVRVRGMLAALIELGGGFHPDLSGAENIYLQGTMLGLRHRQIKRSFDSIVAFSELEPFLPTPVKRYSSGMVVRLGFAIAAHVHPEVLLIDEVLAVGDLAFQQKCFQRIVELKQQGTTMIFISHNLEAVQRLCDRVLLLKGGQALCDGDPAEMIRRYRDSVFASAQGEQDHDKAIGPERDVTIDRLTLCDVDGRPVDTVRTGQAVAIAIDYRARRAIEQPMFRVSLERLDGLVCHSTSSREAGVLNGLLAGEGRLTLQYPELNLLPNHYQVTVDVFEANNLVPLASIRQRCLFQIVSDRYDQGVVHLQHEWIRAD